MVRCSAERRLAPARARARDRGLSDDRRREILHRARATRSPREGQQVRISLRAHTDADRARHAGAAEAAIAGGILRQILLVIVLGEIELAGRRDLGGDGAEALRGERLLIERLRRVGRFLLRIGVSVDRAFGTACRRRCPGACPASGRGSPRTSSAASRRRSSSDRTRPAPLRCGRCGPSRSLHRSGSACDRRHSRPRSRRCRRRAPRTCARRPRSSRARTRPARGLPDKAASASRR